MTRKKSTQEFIDEVYKIHGSTYDYKNTNYVNVKTKLSIRCYKHGEFLQSPPVHLRGDGCPQCGTNRAAELKIRVSAKSFEDRANKVHSNSYDYSQATYVKSTTKLKIICPKHGIFLKSPSDHLNGRGCILCTNKYTPEVFIAKANEVHSNFYSYEKFVYVKSTVKGNITCPIHGEFLQVPSNHIQGSGCPKCAKSKLAKINTKTSLYFIDKARKVHADLYNYEKFIYTKINETGVIVCPTHGDFLQTPSSHLRGSGCQKCSKIKRKSDIAANPNGWSLSAWQKNAESSITFESFKVYILKLTNEDESFYKIGRTHRKLASRVREIPYSCEIICSASNADSKIIFNLENELKRKYKPYKYVPNIRFDGMQECFSDTIPIEELVKRFT